MAQGRIFLLDGDASLTPLREEPYDSEALLQTLLADYPDLLAGEQIDESVPRRWLLVRREQGIAAGPDGSHPWAGCGAYGGPRQNSVPTKPRESRSWFQYVPRQ